MFVGNITERAPDAMVRHLLTTCGHVLSWKRVQGATGKLQVLPLNKVEKRTEYAVNAAGVTARESEEVRRVELAENDVMIVDEKCEKLSLVIYTAQPSFL